VPVAISGAGQRGRNVAPDALDLLGGMPASTRAHARPEDRLGTPRRVGMGDKGLGSANLPHENLL